jgi:hypothetical protein
VSRLLSLGLIAAFAVVATACGANPAPSDDVADAGARTKAAGTVRLEMVIRTSGWSDDTSEYRTTGVVDYANDRSEYREESSGCRSIMIGDVSYDEFAPLEDGLPAGKRWVEFRGEALDSEALYEQSQEQATSDDGEEGINAHSYSIAFGAPEPPPYEYLDYLRDSSGEPKRVGQEDVRGVSTTRYHATIDVRSATRKMLGKEGWKASNIERFLEDVEAGGREIDVWVDSDGLVRRVVTSESWTDGGEVLATESVTTTEYFDFGLEADIQAPPVAEVIDAETWQRAQEKATAKWMDEQAMEDAEENEPLPGGWTDYAPDDSSQSPTCLP